MRALVTGSTGFIGSHLCRALLVEGHQVVAFHRPDSKLLGLEGLAVEHAVGDITQPDTLAPALRGVEVVFHAAAQLGHPRDPQQSYRVTVEGTRNVLRLAAEAGVKRVVHTSSVAALGVPDLPGKPLLMDEHHTWNYRAERWRYGHSKWLAELEVQQAVAQGLEVVIVNPAVVLGAGDLYRVSGDVLIHVAKGHLPVAAPGGLNIVHIQDVVRGHLRALERGRTGERYILGGENMTLLRFLQLTAAAAGVAAPRLVIPAGLIHGLARPVRWLGQFLPLPVQGEILNKVGNYFYYDLSKARGELGLEEPAPAAVAIGEALEWYQAHGYISKKRG